MEVNELKIVIGLLKEISDGNIPCEDDYGIERTKFYVFLGAMQDKGLIKGVRFAKGGKY